jgi:hypothetical protein
MWVGVKTMTEAEHRLLVEVRNLCCPERNTKRINGLTDQTHNIPLFMVGPDDHVRGDWGDGFLDDAWKD